MAKQYKLDQSLNSNARIATLSEMIDEPQIRRDKSDQTSDETRRDQLPLPRKRRREIRNALLSRSVTYCYYFIAQFILGYRSIPGTYRSVRSRDCPIVCTAHGLREQAEISRCLS